MERVPYPSTRVLWSQATESSLTVASKKGIFREAVELRQAREELESPGAQGRGAGAASGVWVAGASGKHPRASLSESALHGPWTRCSGHLPGREQTGWGLVCRPPPRGAPSPAPLWDYGMESGSLPEGKAPLSVRPWSLPGDSCVPRASTRARVPWDVRCPPRLSVKVALRRFELMSTAQCAVTCGSGVALVVLRG